MKKRNFILGIITFLICIFTIFLLSNYNDAQIELSKNNENESNSITYKKENTTTTNNEIIENADSTVLENSIQENITTKNDNVINDNATKQNTTSNVIQDTQEKTVVAENETKTTQKTETEQKKNNTSNETNSKEQETILLNTKEETSQETPATQVIPKQEEQQISETETKNEEISSPPPVVDTIKRISNEELQAERANYLQDIKNIKPGLTYKEVKRGQVFWPYRTSEIEIAVGSVSFGIIYYYVDVYVESNQENFKYYIDWAGNE